MGRAEGKVAFISGAGRGQGRSHAIQLAREGARILAVDLCAQVSSADYPLSTMDDLNETVRLVEASGGRIVARQADVRDQSALDAVIVEGRELLGEIDIVCANAGITSYAPVWELTEETWRDMIDINLTGVWHTAKAAIPSMIAAGRGGSIILTSSTAGLRSYNNTGHYTAAKHGVLGLMRTLANELAQYSIRVNAICPTTVLTPMVENQATYDLFRPDLAHPGLADIREATASMHLLPIPWVEPADISNAIVWLSSDEARYITGVALPVDGGSLTK